MTCQESVALAAIAMAGLGAFVTFLAMKVLEVQREARIAETVAEAMKSVRRAIED